MSLIDTKDIVPILLTAIVFSSLSVVHRVFFPKHYSSFVQFSYEYDTKKSIKSTSIRIIYVIAGTLFLYNIIGLNEKSIYLGIFLSSFLNVWPAVIQFKLISPLITLRKLIQLLGYIFFIIMSVSIAWCTINIFIPLALGYGGYEFFDNKVLEIGFALLSLIVPISLESFIGKISVITIDLDIDTFRGEAYILKQRINTDHPAIEKNKYIIDNVAKENNISVDLLNTIIKLELIYRGDVSIYIAEKILCKFFRKFAIKKDISVGIAQIKISTAQKVLRQNPEKIVENLLDDEFNISVCGKILNIIINKYDFLKSQDDLPDGIDDISEYVACEYLGGFFYEKSQTVLLYESVLYSCVSCTEGWAYSGSFEREEYFLEIYGDFDIDSEDDYESYEELYANLVEHGKVTAIVEQKVIKTLQFRCMNYTSFSIVKDILIQEELDFDIL